jgi:tRNA 2-selenouridine synthase SelU
MNTLQILRLKNGEDIIGSVQQFSANGNFEIVEPMIVELQFRGNQSNLVMAHWLPVQLINKNQTVIGGDEVLATFEPSKDFAEYYVNTVQRIHDVIKQKELASHMDDMSDEEMMEVMNALENISNQTIH